MRPMFTSNRERRLWTWTLTVVVAILATLGLARSLADAVGETAWSVPLFIIACLLVLATILTQGLRVRPSGAELCVALGVVAAYILVFVRMTIATERSHLVEYGVVAVFVYEALLERTSQGRQVPFPALLAVVGTSLLGILDESIQWMLPSRVFELQDILFNVLAAVMAVTTSAALRWARP